MFSSVSVKNIVQCHLLVIALFVVIMAVLSLKISAENRENFSAIGKTNNRVQTVDHALLKIMKVRGDVALLQRDIEHHTHLYDQESKGIISENNYIRQELDKWVKEKKSTSEAQLASEHVTRIAYQMMDKYLAAAGDLQGKSGLMDEANTLYLEMEKSYNNYLGQADKVLSDGVARADSLQITLWWVLGVINVIFILLYISLTRYTSRNIVNRLSEASSVFADISSGQLLRDVPKYGNNEIGQLFTNINSMRLALIEMICSVKVTASKIKHNATEISEGNSSLSTRTEEQASAIQQTAASMDEIKTTVENNTAHAREANMLANEAKVKANDGAAIMSEVVTAMETLSGHAHQISQIITLIDGIASQTNILALNAAVEAARAGEQGRGFAVVATEVRSLAQRSADASSEIRRLIEHSVNDTRVGSRHVSQATETMADIVGMVSSVSTIMQDITRASEEQNRGIQQVAVAINQMDIVTQQNSVLVEESASITRMMDDEARVLEKMVSVFQIDRPQVERNPVSASDD